MRAAAVACDGDPRGVPGVGRARVRRRCRPPGRSCSRSPDCARRRGRRQARATLRARGLLPEERRRNDEPRRHARRSGSQPERLARACAIRDRMPLAGGSDSPRCDARRLARAARRTRDPARRRRCSCARRDRRADGTQRRGQVHAAAPCRRAARAHARKHRARRAGRAAAAEPRRLLPARARRRGGLCAGARARSAWRASAERNPRDLSGGERQRLALAIVTGDGTSAAGCARARRAHARHGSRRQGRARGGAAPPRRARARR